MPGKKPKKQAVAKQRVAAAAKKPTNAKAKTAKTKQAKPVPRQAKAAATKATTKAAATKAASQATTKATKATEVTTKAAEAATKAALPKAAAEATTKVATTKAATQAAAAGEVIVLGTVRAPSGTLGIFDIGLVGYLPREALDPAIVRASVPGDRTLGVVGVPKGKHAWDRVEIIVDEGAEVVAARKLGEVAVDLGRIACMDPAALDAWQHDESLDGRADVVFRGRDAAAVARILGARHLVDGHGWADLPVADAEARYDEVGRKKSANRWQLSSELRRHSHHHQVLTAIAASPTSSTSLELAGTTLTVFTAGDQGVYPVHALVDAADRVVRIRIQLG
ncbi:MAG: hypothetical protein KF773_12010 [Deltaproteobacteria bacterium]|nr:hypothetical protein [Deltaproteobacteria bacterium]